MLPRSAAVKTPYYPMVECRKTSGYLLGRSRRLLNIASILRIFLTRPRCSGHFTTTFEEYFKNC